MKIVRNLFACTLACLFAGQPVLAQTSAPQAQPQKNPNAWIAKEYLTPEAYEQATQQLQAPLKQQHERVKLPFFSRWWKGMTAKQILEPMTPGASKAFVFHTFYLDDTKNKQITPTALQNLNVFKQKSLMATLGKTRTAVGEAAFANLLSQPTTDVTKLRARQQALQALLNNKELLQQLGNALNKFSSAEGHLYKLWQTKALTNTDTTVMTGRWTSGIHTRSLWLREFSLIKESIDAIIVIAMLYQMQFGNGAARGALISGGIGLLLNKLPTFANRNETYYSSMQQLQTILMHTATGVEAMKEVYNALRPNTVFADGIPGFAGLKELCDSTEHDIQWLLSSLDTNTFKGSPSFFSHWGRIVAVYQRLAIQMENIRRAIEGMGAVDAFVAVATALKDQSANRYCVVEFLDSRRPFMNLRGLWNPLLDRNTAVASTVNLGAGQENSRALVVSGQATAGKTTFVTSVAYAALLAQTFGIAPAAGATMTPCNQIHAINTKASFTEQAQQLKEVCERMQLIADHEYALVVMDEPFGSAQAIGEAAAKAWIKSLLNQRCVMVVSSNFAGVTSIAQEMPVVKNFKFELHKTNYGTLDRTFRLEAGVAQTNGGLGLEILREQDLLPE